MAAGEDVSARSRGCSEQKSGSRTYREVHGRRSCSLAGISPLPLSPLIGHRVGWAAPANSVRQQPGFLQRCIIGTESRGASGKRRLADVEALTTQTRLQIIEPDVRVLGQNAPGAIERALGAVGHPLAS